MCVYGGDNANHFREALESVYNQTLLPDEVVLVVDGPVPPSIDKVIQEYSDAHETFRVFRLKENQGHGNARREGFSHCQYPYVAIADADDINLPTRFEKQIRYFAENPKLSAASSGCDHFCDDVNEIINEEYLPEDDADIKVYMKKRCPLCQASTMLKKTDVEKAGGYLDWYHGEDYYLWIRMALAGAVFANSPECLLHVRSDPAQMNRRGGMKYFRSMERLFRYMLKNHIIGVDLYLYNSLGRFVMQVLMPNKLRAWVRKKFL